MRTFAVFAQMLLQSGTPVEMAASKKALQARLATLTFAKIAPAPCENAHLRFTEANLTSLTKAIEQFGGVSANLASVRNSYIERESTSEKAPPNEAVRFKIVSVNRDNQKITTGGDTFGVDVRGPSRVNVAIVDNDDGTYGVSFTPTAEGNYQVLVTLHGESIKQSPFDLCVIDRRVWTFDENEKNPRIALANSLRTSPPADNNRF